MKTLNVMSRILQLLFGATLAIIGLQGILPMLGEREMDVTMAGVLYLGIFLVGLDVFGKGIMK